ncbi:MULTISPECIES: methyl-accepting chemotaxis protein [Marichromatium]|uniref:Methyl-accepting chemotaxis sensory transducer n=1 Tax=Marichromatium gracile TaxID=1048 RepID=A0A4R4A5M0_MARGR|nr:MULTISPECIES: methyl-accepting chemotaxis protein [Marichromatium]MBK1709648.1 methyl-accepting chemotaxis protein [Marichromatium gracile]RNE92368.1 methyl-accepting chemotaxis protein [Marichromatium sp. AB32]TCW34057.1 methyl-accepting chemotaxis sensory transducer [Marichromatium gracile]
MLSRVRISVQLAVGGMAAILVTVALILPSVFHNLGALSERAEQRRLQDLFLTLRSALDEEATRAVSLAAALSNVPDVRAAFAAGDRARLRELTLPLFERMHRQYGLVQFQFHTPPATSFLRLHMPEKFGDDLSGFRHTVLAANRTRAPVSGLEEGRAGLGIRGIVPMFAPDGRHRGSVEFGLSFGEPFFVDFTERFGARAQLTLRRGQDFEPFAGTIEDGTRLTAEEMRQVIAGERIQRQILYRDTPMALLAQAITDYAGEPVGVVELLLDRSDDVGAFNRAIRDALLFSLLALCVGAVLTWLLSRAIARPIRAAATRMNDIAHGDGDLTQHLEARGRNELTELAVAFNAFVDRIHNLVRELVGGGDRLSEAAGGLSATSEQIRAQLERQQSGTDQVATAMTEMTATVAEVARNATRAAEATRDMEREAGGGAAVVRETIDAIESLAAAVENAATVIARLSDDAESIGRILDVIGGIAEQTNLLALNAAIEAARAGEQGRGFAVVADEVRSLAGRTQSATHEIQGMIEALQGGAREAVTVMADGRTKAGESVAQAGRAGASLEAITAEVATVNDMNGQIASAAEQQRAVAEEIDRNLSGISHEEEEIAAVSRRIAEAAEALAALAAEQQERTRRFKV